MTLRSFTVAVILVAIAGFPMALVAGKSCPATAAQCEIQIRTMLEGKRYLGAKLAETRNGVVVASVVNGSPAYRAGLHEGDRIVAVNGQDVSRARVRAIKELLERNKDNRRALFIVFRGGTLKTIRARLEVMSKSQIDKVIAAHLRSAHSTAERRR